MLVVPVPCRSDNYMYLIADESTGKTAVVDPYDPSKLYAAAKEHNLTLGDSLLLTHHHNDHSGGNAQVLKDFPQIESYAGSDTIPGNKHILKHGEQFKIGNLDVKAVHTPCHTQDHICYFVEDKEKDQRYVFTGDTLFISGCGRFFEGTAKEMDTALNKRLIELPHDTIVACGHEYTKSNVAFSQSVDPSNKRIQELAKRCETEEVTTCKSTIADELEWNVFMRLGSEAVRNKTGAGSAVDAMAALREAKNNFRG